MLQYVRVCQNKKKTVSAGTVAVADLAGDGWTAHGSGVSGDSWTAHGSGVSGRVCQRTGEGRGKSGQSRRRRAATTVGAALTAEIAQLGER